MACDILCWIVLYGIVAYVRRDQFFVSPFEFVLVDCVALAVILQALYIVRPVAAGMLMALWTGLFIR